MDGPFHSGEREAQRRAGVEEPPLGAGIRAFMPDQHRQFFAQLPFVAVATLDADGAPIATLLTGAPGFVASPDPRRLTIAAGAPDPCGERLVAGAPIGLLGIELETRRRNRANGRIVAADAGGLQIEVTQSFGNCPRYIHVREVALLDAPAGGLERFEGLDAAAAAMAARADTLFVATASGRGVENGGVDISHRGGPRGFVRVGGETLTIPDFAGNRYFNTLGNLLLEPRAALLFVDFETGLVTQLQGRAEVAWEPDAERDGEPAAERSWRFTATRGWRRASGLRGRLAPRPPAGGRL
jgi:hypothetical protein